VRLSTLRATCFACSRLIESRSAADYVDDKLQRFHPSCLNARKKNTDLRPAPAALTTTTPSPSAGAAAPSPRRSGFALWSHRTTVQQRAALAAGFRRLLRGRRRLRGAQIDKLLVVEEQLNELGLPANFRAGVH